MLGSTVSKALRVAGGQEASETANFVEMMDCFFDCLNVRNYTSGKRSRNPFKQPYRTSSDFRLNVCTVHTYILLSYTCVCS